MWHHSLKIPDEDSRKLNMALRLPTMLAPAAIVTLRPFHSTNDKNVQWRLRVGHLQGEEACPLYPRVL